jgi:hypothetical protein
MGVITTAAGEGVPQAASNSFRKRYCNFKKPPYAHRLNLPKNGCLVVCTGSGAWERAKLRYWFPGAKVALPPGTDPKGYDWGIAAGRKVMVCGFGTPEPFTTIVRLGSLLLSAGAQLVLYVPEHGPITRIDPRRV